MPIDSASPKKNAVRLLPLSLFALYLAAFPGESRAAKLVEVKIVDKDYVMVHFKDGDVVFRDDGKGPSAFQSISHTEGQDTVKTYGSPLNTTVATAAGTWKITSSDDPGYMGGRSPAGCHRKTRLNGMSEKEWAGSDFRYLHTIEHFIYLKLPRSLEQGKKYTLRFGAGTNSDIDSARFTFDCFNSRSEAIHVNLAGYNPNTVIKAADLYIWMGDGGARDYSSFEGNAVYVYDVATQEKTKAGKVAFWKKKAKEAQGYTLIASDVWNADFSPFPKSGRFRLAVEGVGCSEDFIIGPNAFWEPLRVSVRGFFYMRAGQDSTGAIRPVPRRPLYIPGKNPPNTKVYITTLHPYHGDWKRFSNGSDPFDKKDEWAAYKKPGSPVNPDAWGGHVDAADWDRHLGHISMAFDLLLPYFLTKGAISDDTMGIAESGNGIPDIIDEARYEVDFWLRLRDGAGYSHGLNNPNAMNVYYQAGTTAMAAWANAAMAAMLGDCFRLCGKSRLADTYRDSAIAAYNHAGGLPDRQLDSTLDIGVGAILGRDLKMTAAAFLFDLTGDMTYETVVKEESVCAGASSEIHAGTRNQTWATAAYLLTDRPVRFPALQSAMKSAVYSQAKQKHAEFMNVRPSRRSTDNTTGYFQTMQNVHLALIAHTTARTKSDKDLFHKALTLEADWSLGRNPLNIIQMTTASTNLGSKRSIENCYTTGGNDGTPGLHPGHTPYLNHDDWSPAMVMGSPGWMTGKCYPLFSQWPKAEGYFNTRYVWAHSEFTPQQTMCGKTALYGYLYKIDATEKIPVLQKGPKTPALRLSVAGSAAIRLPGPGVYSLRAIDLSGKTVWSNPRLNVTGNSRIAIPLFGNKVAIVTVRGSGGTWTIKVMGVR